LAQLAVAVRAPTKQRRYIGYIRVNVSEVKLTNPWSFKPTVEPRQSDRADMEALPCATF
jgi:hypothetical protein